MLIVIRNKGFNWQLYDQMMMNLLGMDWCCAYGVLFYVFIHSVLWWPGFSVPICAT